MLKAANVLIEIEGVIYIHVLVYIVPPLIFEVHKKGVMVFNATFNNIQLYRGG